MRASARPKGAHAAADAAADVGILQQDKVVRHAGDVVGDDASEAFAFDLGEVGVGELFRLGDPELEELGDHLFRLGVFELQSGAGVERVVEVALLLDALAFGERGEDGHPLAEGADLRERVGAGLCDVGGGGLDEVEGERLLHGLQGVVEDELLRRMGMSAQYRVITAAQDADVVADVADVEQLGLDAVVEVGGEVGDLVGEVDDLGFERRLAVEQVLGELGMGGGAVVPRVLDDAFAHGEREVQAAMAGVALLEALHDAQGVQIVVKAEAVGLQAAVERALAGVAEGRVADVMHQSEGFGEVFIEADRFGDLAGDLRDLNRMGEAAAKVVGGTTGEDLRLAGEAAEGARLDDAVAVAIEGRAVVADGRGKGAHGEPALFFAEDTTGMKMGSHRLRV